MKRWSVTVQRRIDIGPYKYAVIGIEAPDVDHAVDTVIDGRAEVELVEAHELRFSDSEE